MIKINHVEKHYGKRSLWGPKPKPIIKDVSLDCPVDEAIAIIGESGSGKSTLSRMILGIERPDKGTVTLNDQPMYKKKVRRHQIGAVFQDYTSSLHPFQTVRDILFEVMCQCDKQSTDEMEVAAKTLLEEVGLSEDFLDKYPNMLSGGEAQRLLFPERYVLIQLISCSMRAISALDMSIQTQILDLLKRLKHTRHLSYIFITHDIQAATYLCDRLVIFKDGQIEEQITTRDLHTTTNAYTQALIDKQLSF